MRRLAVVLLSLVESLLAAEARINNATSLPDNARFQVVQSSLLARLTFKVDKYDGRVWMFYESQGGFLWVPMIVKGLPKISPGSARFQIFVSGFLARDTFLLDSATGRTWNPDAATTLRRPAFLAA